VLRSRRAARPPGRRVAAAPERSRSTARRSRRKRWTVGPLPDPARREPRRGLRHADGLERRRRPTVIRMRRQAGRVDARDRPRAADPRRP